MMFLFSELNLIWSWTHLGYANNFEQFKVVNDNTKRINVDEVSLDEFIELYEKPSIPVVITGAQKNWDASEKWTLHVR